MSSGYQTIKSKRKRKNIPKAVKLAVWKKYLSDTDLEGKCFVGCGTSIQIHNFEAGHVIAFANGGADMIDNLRPICSLCNKSMGATNMNEFIDKFGFKNNYDVGLNSNFDTIPSPSINDDISISNGLVASAVTLLAIETFYKIRQVFN
jgi:hypothetical protein